MRERNFEMTFRIFSVLVSQVNVLKSYLDSEIALLLDEIVRLENVQ